MTVKEYQQRRRMVQMSRRNRELRRETETAAVRSAEVEKRLIDSMSEMKAMIAQFERKSDAFMGRIGEGGS
jgi:hypothetical protein